MLRVVICFIVMALVVGFAKQSIFAFNHKSCDRCSAKNCHNDAQSRKTASACACSYQLALQCYVSKTSSLPELNFAGYLKHAYNLAYGFLPTEDVFHPPRA